MCTVLQPPGVNPTAVNKYIIIIIRVIHLEPCLVLAVLFVSYCVLLRDFKCLLQPTLKLMYSVEIYVHNNVL